MTNVGAKVVCANFSAKVVCENVSANVVCTNVSAKVVCEPRFSLKVNYSPVALLVLFSQPSSTESLNCASYFYSELSLKSLETSSACGLKKNFVGRETLSLNPFCCRTPPESIAFWKGDLKIYLESFIHFFSIAKHRAQENLKSVCEHCEQISNYKFTQEIKLLSGKAYFRKHCLFCC